MKTKIGVNGACGRMGKRIVQLAHEDPTLHIVAAIDSADHPEHGHDIGEAAGLGKLGVPVTAAIPLDVHVEAMIDFSMPEGTMNILQTCIARKIPLVVATTGFTENQKREIEGAAHHTAILFAPNMSLVVNVR